MRILTFTTLYPHAGNPTHGIFVENRLRHVMKNHDVDVRVIAPVPWFPSDASIFGHYAAYAKAPEAETRHGISVEHPRYMLIPKVGMTMVAKSLADCFEKAARKLIEEGWDFDLIDAHYYYPDGVAATEVAERLGKPVVITGRGTDINLIPQYEPQREMILEAADKTDASITVCQALKDELVRLGADEEKITTLRNGVDLDLFRPMDRDAIRERLSLQGAVIASVGHLIERKGHDLAIRAIVQMPEVTLLIAGDGTDETALKDLTQELSVQDRVRFLGRIDHETLPEIYNAADALVLASSREGWPNVLLEAMACGTPAIAAPVWGTSEIITTPDAGLLAADRSVDAFRDSIKELLAALPARTDTRAYAEKFSWDETADGVIAVWQQAIDNFDPQKIAASFTDWQISAPYTLPDNSPTLLVSVDTEEVFDWDSDAFSDHTVAAPEDIHRFQILCESHNIKPLYFITYPLMENEKTAAYFKSLHAAGKADLGLHLHQWVTPPHNQENTPFTSYQCNLPPQLHSEKLHALASKFEETFGFAAHAHRAGRYGVAPHIHEALLTAGITHDFSPSPGSDQTASGGPDFSGASSASWVRESEDGDKLVCIPVTGGRFRMGTRKLLSQPLSKMSGSGKLSSLSKRTSACIRLTPEGVALEDLQALTEEMLKQDISLLTFSLHSTSLTQGATPYSSAQKDIETLLQTTDQYLTWFRQEINGRFAELSMFEL
jgi:glycosyltransferase involved in cell wall biosynthesis